MCAVCIDFEKGKLTAEEAWRNLSEMSQVKTVTDEEILHYLEAGRKIIEGELDK